MTRVAFLTYAEQPQLYYDGRIAADLLRSRGEWSFVFFMKEYSHAVLKVPKPGDFRVQSDFGGRLDESVPPLRLIEQAQALLVEVSEQWSHPVD